MRGSTANPIDGLSKSHGSPAHAGIDPVLKLPVDWIPGLPRACGDRPVHSVGRLNEKLLPEKVTPPEGVQEIGELELPPPPHEAKNI